MLPELGQFTLIMALVMALIQAILPLVGAQRGNHALMAVAKPAARMQFLFLVLAFGVLTHAFIVSDFSVLYVANNSNSTLPLFYRISAVWGAHEGSLLLWALVLGVWTFAVTLFNRGLPQYFLARVLAVMGLISTGFLLFMLTTSNPFERIFPVPANGGDLNPLLQDFGLIVHPPMLYTGYVGFSVAFAFAIAALLGGRMDTAWVRWTRPWTTIAWVFLSLGIALGSWWAYYELGWGGWWAWDPVENASFMPWLVGTALIHSLATTEKRGVFMNWTILLAICAFSLSLLGTFLVRSGVLTSVHAFATDPARGTFILAFLVVVIGGSLTLYSIRAPKTFAGGGSFKLVSRETFLLLNSLLLSVAMLTVLLGTLYPLLADSLGMGKLSVGAPYFNSVFVPIMIPLVILMGVGQLSRWKSDSLQRLWQHLRYALAAAAVLGIGIAAMLGTQVIGIAIGLSLGVWVILSTLIGLRERVRNKHHPWSSLLRLPRSSYGMSLAHIGFGITIIGVTFTSLLSTDVHLRMAPGQDKTFSGYRFHFDSVKKMDGPNYRATEALFEVYRGDEQVAVLRPQKRIYLVRSMPMTEAGIDPGIGRDLYVSLGEPLGGEAWSIRLYDKPLIRWIWLGAIFMVIGGLFSVSDPRYRLSTRRSTVPTSGAQTAKA